MTKQFEARPTEYKGILYRSKCEAMFARFLELEIDDNAYMCSHEGPHFLFDSFGRYRGGFVYEPRGLEVDGWTPDFLLWECSGVVVHKARIPTLNYTLIEYKPSKPTVAYAEEFATRYEQIMARFDEVQLFEFSRRCSGKLYFGSVFNERRGCAVIEDGRVDWDDMDWLANYEDQIKATRFDLVAASE